MNEERVFSIGLGIVCSLRGLILEVDVVKVREIDIHFTYISIELDSVKLVSCLE